MKRTALVALTLCTGLFGALSAVGTRAAFAAGPADPNAARAVDLFNQGKVAADQGDYTEACPKFAESARLDPRVGTLARLGECEEKLGRLVSARAHWGAARDLALRTHDARADHAQREYTRIDALTPKLRLTLEGTPPPDFAATIDTDKFDASSLGTPIPVEPGAHVVRATATGKAPFSANVVTAADGASTSVPIVLAEPTIATAAPPPPLPPGPAPPPPAEGSWWNGGKAAAVVVGAVGVVGLGVGAAFGGLTYSEWNTAKHDCGTGCTSTSSANGEKSTALTYSTISDIGLAAGGAAVVAAAIVWFTAGKSQSGSAAAVQVLPSVGPGGMGIAVTGPMGFF